MSKGRQRIGRLAIFVTAIVAAWAWFGTNLSADKAKALLMHDLNSED